MKKKLFLVFVLTFSIFVKAQDTSGYQLFAHYPFTSNGTEATGTFADADLFNVTFSTDGVYSNGNYYGDDQTTGALIQTPNFTNFPDTDFIFTVNIKPELQDQPILLFGGIWGQWLYIETVSGGKLSATVRISQSDIEVYTSPNSVIQVNNTYVLGITYKASNNTFKLYLDNTLIHSFTPTAPPYADNDYTITNQHGGYGFTYKGHYKDLKIYKAGTAGIEENPLQNQIKIYPNPFNDNISIDSLYDIKTISIYDILGKQILKTSSITSSINTSKLQKGVYLLKIKLTDNRILTQKIIKK